MSIDKFIKELKEFKTSDTVTNMYADSFDFHEQTTNNLHLYLNKMVEIKPEYLLVGEAPGYLGCRLSGIPFTSETSILTISFFYNSYPICEFCKNTANVKENWIIRNRNCLVEETTAKIVWEKLEKENFYPLLWNAFPFHPHEKGAEMSNRAPTSNEIDKGKKYIENLQDMFPSIKHIYAVGKKAQKSLGLADVFYIHHPSHGGKNDFRTGIDKLLQLKNNRNYIEF